MSKIIKPSAVLFDFDDTLVNSRPIIDRALKATLARFNINENILSAKNIDVNRSMRDYFQQIFGSQVYQARDVYYQYYTEYSKNIEKLDNAEQVLDFLKSLKLFVAVVSNKNGTRLRDEVKNKFNWQHYFAAIVGAGDASEDKPSIQPALLALKNSGLKEFSSCLMIGDNQVDYQLAKNLGCQFILYGEAQVDVECRVKDHNELLAILKKLFM
jgi:phosphoglycolate phosphatase